ANLAVTLSLASEKTITVDYRSAAGGSASTDDFTLTPSTLTFPPGTTSLPVPVAITSDMLDEDNETAQFSLVNATNATLAAAQHTLTINDDDAPPTLDFQQATSTAAEGTATHAVTVKLSAPSGRPIQFSATRTGGSATAADFTLSTTSVTIPPGATTATFNVTVLDDANDDDDETLVLALGGLVNASPGPQTSHTVTITDNDNGPLVRFDTGTPDRAAAEQDISSATHVYRVVLSAASNNQVTVQVAVGGTAMNNDYDIGSGDIPVVFQPGQTSRDIRIIVGADGSPEQNETVTLTLGTVTNGSNATDNQVRTHTITNDD
ncbi:MAG TPA: Calx-beta domain-containing protein, partial [Kofleriaceae bacterium]|nr:Calx-beta domain-containing protein [Kofleriaceae bacterium]